MGKLILYAIYIYIYKFGKYYYNLSFYVKIYLLAGWDELGAFRSLHLPQKTWQIHFPEIGFLIEQSFIIIIHNSFIISTITYLSLKT